MAYKKADSNSFAEYQMGEGFQAAVTGDVSTKTAGKTIRNTFNAQKLAKIKGYEGYPSHYGDYGSDYGDSGVPGLPGDLNTTKAAHLLMKNAVRLPAGLEGDGREYDLNTRRSAKKILSSEKAQGYHGYEGIDLNTEQSARTILNSARAQGFDGHSRYSGYSGADLTTEQSARSILNAARAQGYHGVDDDAFAGYTSNLGQPLTMKAASEIAREDKISDDVDEFGGLGNLGQQDNMESWHTYFHQATLAKTDTDMLSSLKKAVKAVPDDTPASVKRSYYDTAMKMMRVRKNTDLRYLDINRVEIESNLGWLVNPNIPKTGGFDAMLNKVIGRVGAKLGKGDQDDLKMLKNQSLGRQLKEELYKTGQLSDWSLPDPKYLYAGIGILGLGAAYCYFKNKKAVALKKNKKKK